MQWMLLPLKRYADFKGRSRRREYWMFALGIMIAMTVLILLTGGLADDGSGPSGGFALVGLFFIAIFVPSLAVQVRRFHDQGRSGWLILLNLIPYIGSLIVLVFMCLPGNPGPNRFGPDPKGMDLSDTFA